MGKRKGDIEIGYRMVEELLRLFGTKAEAIRKLPCERHAIGYWEEGQTPGGHMLARLHYCGGDVLYVLTGRRKEKQ